jgi:hypothetical protein
MKKRGLHRHISKSQLPKLPIGIKVLIAYTSVIALAYLLYLLFGLTKPVSVIFGNLISGTGAAIIELASLALLIVIIYGLAKRHFWVFYISLTWFIFGAVNALVSLISFRSEFDVLRTALVASSLVVIVLNGIIAWYIYSEKYFFKTKHMNKETKAKDKFFVHVLVAFLIVAILMLSTFGINFYRTTLKTTKSLVEELTATSFPDAVCEQKTGS